MKKSDKIFLNVLISASLALLLSLLAWSVLKVKAQEQFEKDSAQVQESVRQEVSRYEALLLSIRSFIVSSPNITKVQFDNYLSSLNLQNYPAIDIIGVSQHVESKQIIDFYENLIEDYKAANDLPITTELAIEKRRDALLLSDAPGHVIIKYISPKAKISEYVGWSFPFPQVSRKDYERQLTTGILTSRARGLLTQEAQNDQIVSLRAGVIVRPPKNSSSQESLPNNNQVLSINNSYMLGAVRMNILLNETFFKHLPTDGYLKYQVYSPEEDGKALVFDNRFKKEATVAWPKHLYQINNLVFKEDSKFRMGEREFFLQAFTSEYPPNVDGLAAIYGLGIFSFCLSFLLIHLAVFRKIEAYAASKEATRQVEQLFFQANNDELTGLENRRSLFQELNANIKLSNKKSMLLFFIDLDGFKSINDNLGHQAGDELLIQYAMRLKAYVNAAYTKLYRIGGDEFIILIDKEKSAQKWGPDEIATYAQNVLALTSNSFYVSNQRYPISQSMGVADFPLDASTADELVKSADTAMYEAKKLGKSQFVVYSRDISKKIKDKIFMRSQLQKALEHKEFSILFQPKFVKEDGKYKVCGAEALMRWHNDKLSQVPPNTFIPLAEEAGLIPEIDNYLIHEVGRNICSMKEAGINTVHIPVSINVSARQFSNIDLPEVFMNALTSYNVCPSNVIIEITEGSTMREPAKAQKILQKFRDYGFGISIDDFGTGYSSMNYLRQFPTTEVKIDKSFTDDILSDSDDRIIIEGIINMGQKLNLTVVVEGVETLEQVQWVESVAGEKIVFQGYHFSKPLPLNDFKEFVLKNQNEI